MEVDSQRRGSGPPVFRDILTRVAPARRLVTGGTISFSFVDMHVDMVANADFGFALIEKETADGVLEFNRHLQRLW